MRSVATVEIFEVTDAHRRAFEAGKGALEKMLRLSLPEGWPAFPDSLKGTGHEQWPFYFFVDPEMGCVIGSGGYLCTPDKNRKVQVGYEVAPAHRNRGLATEAMRKVLSRRRDATIVAFTYSDADASASVLRKLGFWCSGSYELPSTPRVWRWVATSEAVVGG